MFMRFCKKFWVIIKILLMFFEWMKEEIFFLFVVGVLEKLLYKMYLEYFVIINKFFFLRGKEKIRFKLIWVLIEGNDIVERKDD